MKEIKMKVKTYVEDMIVVFTVFEEDGKIGGETFDFNDLPEDGEIRNLVSLYGLKKLVSDRTSGVTNKLDKLVAMDKVMDLLVSGEWQKERVVGAVVTSVEVEALAQHKGLTVPQVQKALAVYDADTRKKILASEIVVEIAAEIREARKDAEVASLDDMI